MSLVIQARRREKAALLISRSQLHGDKLKEEEEEEREKKAASNSHNTGDQLSQEVRA